MHVPQASRGGGHKWVCPPPPFGKIKCFNFAINLLIFCIYDCVYFFFFTETQALDVLALVAENRRLVDLNEQLRTENKCLQEECAKLVLTNEDLLRKLR